ncbi:BadF/BadG/BcrA/BcrD ATPase family protein [Hyperthermus butylicus]|uniref:N-acetylglucosamine kinase n=1 Tax=Hyperthermus butylicus (strain DSM 5456 / JCM 9403 / PLM1-5) TaxID=415426 RepID=A2BN46_HYPBU|nr:BadF/BadG/BcrA/BcrD ATPase family protein [Hyperthermus butylicus]ABM81407.1 putative N-acetylglucosamine kinase [Hyperthermus butylicus DSM 5456]
MLVAGVDGGATSTKAIVASLETGSVWAGLAGPSNPVNVGAVEAGRNIVAAIEAALRGTGYSIDDVVVVVAGLAGLDSAIVRRQLESYVKESSGLGDRLVVEHDAHIALMHASRGAPGLVVIAGTGSIAYAYTARGERVVVGDRGWLLGDEGSGFWVARVALRRLARSLDGRSGWDCLSRGLAVRLGVTSSDELMYWFYLTRGRIDRIAAVARHVVELADEGCSEAIHILEEGAMLLAEAAIVAARRTGIVQAYYTGSMFRSRVFRRVFTERLSRHGIKAVERRIYPAVGALLLALRSAGYKGDIVQLLTHAESIAEKLYSD